MLHPDSFPQAVLERVRQAWLQSRRDAVPPSQMRTRGGSCGEHVRRPWSRRAAAPSRVRASARSLRSLRPIALCGTQRVCAAPRVCCVAGALRVERVRGWRQH